MSSTSSEPKRHIFANLAFLVPLALAAAALIGWSIYWYVAAHRAEAALAAWMAREAQAGRTWVCPEQTLGGYPFTVQISCLNAQFQGAVLGRKFSGTLREFRASSPLLQPDFVSAELEPPFTAKSSDGTIDVLVQWDNLFFEFEGSPDALTRTSLVGHQVSVRGTFGGSGATAAEIGRFNTYAVKISERADLAYKFLLALNQVSLPALERLLDLNGRSAFAFEGTITHADFGGAGRFADQLERWRSANGHIDLTTARFTSGTKKLEAQGGLDLDGAHRVRGQLDAEFSGLDPALQQLGVDPLILTAGSVLADLLGNRTVGDSVSRGASRLHVPLTIADGFLAVGPIRTPIQFPPLY